MKCPVDNTELLMADRYGIEIDYCPKCRGVWLDRGELDKIIDRVAGPDEANEGDYPQEGDKPEGGSGRYPPEEYRDGSSGRYPPEGDSSRRYPPPGGMGGPGGRGPGPRPEDSQSEPPRRKRGGILGDIFNI